MERVIIDMDEVIADTMGEMINWYRDKYGKEVDYEKMTAGSWAKGFPAEHLPLIRERLMSPGFFRNLPVMPDSVEVLREMNKVYEIFIVSAAIEFPHSLKDKLDWLLEYFPFFTWRQLVLCGDKRMIHGDHMIDDHPRNLVHFPGKKYLYHSPHNVNVTEYHRLHDWKEAAGIFL
jgi:5'(3')-deoxyribonucleotidase